MQNIRMRYEYEELHRPKRRELHYEPACQKDTKTQANTNESRFLSSRSDWDRANLGPGMARIVSSEQDPTQLSLLSVITKAG